MAKINSKLSIGCYSIKKSVDQERRITLRNHVIYAIDVSGSMYEDLPAMKTQLKNQLSFNSSTNAIISMIVFSGKSQCYELFSGIEISDLKSMELAKSMIDKYLEPLGATAFLPPLEMTSNVVENIERIYGNVSHQMLFMTDGNDNSYEDELILNKISNMSNTVNSIIVEYGLYADTDMLNRMTISGNGVKLYARDLNKYIEYSEMTLKKPVTEKILLDISEFKNKMDKQILFAISNGNVIAIDTKKKDAVMIPDDVTKVYYYGESDEQVDQDGYYVMAYGSTLLNRYYDAEAIMCTVGDKRLIDNIASAFGKFALLNVQQQLYDATVNEHARFVDGVDKNYNSDPNRYCLMDLIKDLSDGDNRWHPGNKHFQYSRTGVAMVESEPNPHINFIRRYNPDGYALKDLTYNSERANISILTKIDGTVAVQNSNVGSFHADTFIWRNYTILKDGIVNINKLPVTLDDKTKERVLKHVDNYVDPDNDSIIILDISNLPIINRNMVKRNISAKHLSEIESELILNQAMLKYAKSIIPSNGIAPISMRERYKTLTEPQLEYLMANGLTANGYAPSVTSSDSSDQYQSFSLKTKVEKLSSIPKISDTIKKINENKKLTMGDNLVKLAINNFDKIVADNNGDLNKSYESVNEIRKDLIMQKAKTIFTIIITKQWFKEFNGYDDNVISCTINKGDDAINTNVKFEFAESTIKI